MTLPRKGTRSLEVDGVVYRWRIRKKTTTAQAERRTTMIVAVQREDAPSLLIVDVGLHRPVPWLLEHQTQITPDKVRAMVRSALAAGWAPAEPAPFTHRYPIIRDSA